MDVLGGQRWRVDHSDALDVLAALPDGSVSLICTDPPFYRVKGEAWDRQWDSLDAFLAWIGTLCEQWRRVLAPNGSLYVFAWPERAAAVEVEIGRWFNVIQRVTWAKPAHATKAEMFRKGDLRSFFPASEAIIFAEQRGSDAMARGEAGYVAACDEVRGSVFEPLRAYLDGERVAAGVDKIACNVACGFSAAAGGMAARHYFGRSQWQLPTAEHYAALRDLFNRSNGGGHLRREYDDLRREYDDLRRPFNADASRPYTDVWTYPTVGAAADKHPCEKPIAMMRHIVATSSRPGDLVLDCFCGSGVTGEAALAEGRRVLLCDADATWAQRSRFRCARAEAAGPSPTVATATAARPLGYRYRPETATQLDLLASGGER